MVVFSPDVQAVVDDMLPRCRALAEGRFAVSIGGSIGRRTSDTLSDIDFRLFCDRVVEDPDQRARVREQLDAGTAQWAERGVVIDGCWIRTIADIDAQLAQWHEGVGVPTELVWTIWGYRLLTDVNNQASVEDPYGVVARWKEQLRQYPPKLKRAVLQKNLASLRYWRDDYHYRNKVRRKDIVFLAGLASKLVHEMIEILFALDETSYVGDGYNLTVIERLRHVPDNFAARVEEILYPRDAEGKFEQQYRDLLQLIDDVEALAGRLSAEA